MPEPNLVQSQILPGQLLSPVNKLRRYSGKQSGNNDGATTNRLRLSLKRSDTAFIKLK